MPADKSDFGAKYHSAPKSTLFERIGLRFALPPVPVRWMSNRFSPASWPKSGRAIVRLTANRLIRFLVNSNRKFALGSRSKYLFSVVTGVHTLLIRLLVTDSLVC